MELPGGRVLDLAAGSGRHALLLSQLGHAVVAADRDMSALPAHPAILAVATDLEDGSPWALGGNYDGIVVTNYLHRPLLPQLVAALEPKGGVLIYETFAVGNERFGKPSNPDFLLRPGELLELAQGWLVIAYENLQIALPRPALVQRIAARVV